LRAPREDDRFAPERSQGERRGGEVKRARVRVRGRVQGVFFRAETRDRARSVEVGGWVRNAPDGSVEAVFEGRAEAVELLVSWCRRGPAGARVEEVDVAWEEPRGERSFSIA
jgi:acylphosphatase